MKTIKLACNKEYIIGNIDNRIYGTLLEHMGRTLYTGVYNPSWAKKEQSQFNLQVAEAIKKAGITTVRYPGGNFVSTYNWEDGVGPVEKRPQRLDLAWRSTETNEFGTDEFMNWLKVINAKPLMAVNLGTRGIQDAINFIEYCNIPSGSKYSQMRIDNGVKDPYNIKMWCLGNEMDGKWQIGHKTAHEYGRLAAETSKAMKVVDPTIETVLCGSSLNTMDTYPDWELQVLDDAYEYVDYISLHQYFGGQDKGTESFLRQADEINDYIKTVMAACKVTKAKKKAKNNVYISFDEWGVWTRESCETVNEADAVRWSKAPAISEMIYTFEDALLFAGMLMSLMKNCDVVKIACQSLVANISSMIMTTQDGEMWFQTTYYPFSLMANYGKGIVLDTRDNDKESNVSSVVVYNKQKNEVVLFALNRNTSEEIEVETVLNGFNLKEVIEHVVFQEDNLKVTNQIKHDAVVPKTANDSLIKNGTIISKLQKTSFNMIRIKV